MNHRGEMSFEIQRLYGGELALQTIGAADVLLIGAVPVNNFFDMLAEGQATVVDGTLIVDGREVRVHNRVNYEDEKGNYTILVGEDGNSLLGWIDTPEGRLNVTAGINKTDIFGAFVLLEAARKHRIKKFIQISTDEVYGSIEQGSFKESDPLMPSSPYSASKAGADRLAYSYYVTYDLPIIVTRCSNNFGPYQYPEKLISLFVTNALEDKNLPVYGDGKNVRDWIYVWDHCNAIDFIIMIFLALIGSILIYNYYPEIFYILSFVFIIIIIFFIFLMKEKRGNWLFRLFIKPLFPKKFRDKIDKSIKLLYEDLPKHKDIIFLFLIGLSVWIIFGLQVYIIAYSFSIDIPVISFIAFGDIFGKAKVRTAVDGNMIVVIYYS